MSNNSNVKKTISDKKWVLIIAVIIIVAAILVVVLRANGSSASADSVGIGNITASDNKGFGNTSSDPSDENTAADENVGSENTETNNNERPAENGGNSSGSENSGNSGNSDSTGNNGNNGNSGNNSGSEDTGDSDDSGNTDNGNSGENTEDGETDDTPVTQPDIEISQQANADYEKWLAATMVVCVSIEYPDFELVGIYSASETTMENKFSSEGAYVVFTSGGQRMAVHSVALSEERTAGGTRDISSQSIGYATFDAVAPSAIDTSAMTELSADELEKLIDQSLLISVYTH